MENMPVNTTLAELTESTVYHLNETFPTTVLNTDHIALVVPMFQLKIVYYTIGTLGMLDNFFVLYVILRSKDMRSQIPNLYIMNQSLADFMGSFLMVTTSMFEEPKRRLAGFADEIYCKFWLTKWLLWALFIVSTYNLNVISVERYLAVVHPIWHKTSFDKKKALVSMALVWIISFVYMGPYSMAPATLKEGKCHLFTNFVTPESQRAIGILNYFVMFLIPIVTLIFCYSKMALALYGRIHPSGQGSVQMNRAMRNVIKTMAVVSICFILCGIWNQTYFLMFQLGYPTDFTSIFYHFTVVAVFFNCCINPFVYVLKYKSFQRNVMRLMPWLPRLGRKEESVSTDTVTTQAVTK